MWVAVEPFFVEHQLDYAQIVMYEVVIDNQNLAAELFYAITEGEHSATIRSANLLQNFLRFLF
jgi:hypothetical protein